MKPVIAPADQQPADFTFKDTAKVDAIIARYPEGKQQSAVMPLLDLAMREVADDGRSGRWIPRAAIEVIAKRLDMAPIRVMEVATFYSMYALSPTGKHHIQCCTTTPCCLSKAGDILKVCEKHLGIKVGESTADGQFTLSEVECLGACVNAPVVQINDDYFEDLNPERMVEILEALKNGDAVQAGSQTGRRDSMAASGPTTLKNAAKKAGV